MTMSKPIGLLIGRGPTDSKCQQPSMIQTPALDPRCPVTRSFSIEGAKRVSPIGIVNPHRGSYAARHAGFKEERRTAEQWHSPVGRPFRGGGSAGH